jgi:UDP-glucose 4-epimerase
VFSSIADVSKAKKILKWKAIKGIKNMCEDNWRWKNTNPN